MRTRLFTLLICSPLAAMAHPGHILFPAVAAPGDAASVTDKVVIGKGAATYEAVPGWCKLPGGKKIGNTHGNIVVDKAGQVYFTTDTDFSICVYTAAGDFVRSLPKKLKGCHDIQLVEEDGEEFIYAAHLSQKRLVKLKLDGSEVWAAGCPMESKKYQNAKQYNPTGVAVVPGGDVYVSDGYGKNWVHRYTRDGKYVSSFGGRGTEPGLFRTCHGIEVDERSGTPILLVCDRENRRLQHFDLDGKHLAVISTGLRRPCSASLHGEFVAIAELEARVTILNGKNEVVAHLGDNPNKEHWARNPVPPAEWKVGVFTAPHGVCYDKAGNLYVMDWNSTGRISRLSKQ